MSRLHRVQNLQRLLGVVVLEPNLRQQHARVIEPLVGAIRLEEIAQDRLGFLELPLHEHELRGVELHNRIARRGVDRRQQMSRRRLEIAIEPRHESLEMCYPGVCGASLALRLRQGGTGPLEIGLAHRRKAAFNH